MTTLPLFRCDVCFKDFNYGDNLKRHRKNVHGIGPPGMLAIESPQQQKKQQRQLQLQHQQQQHDHMLSMSSSTASSPTSSTVASIVKEEDLNNINGLVKVASPTIASSSSNASSSASSSRGGSGKKGGEAVCEICDKIFNSSFNLKRHHMAVHRDTRILYGCDECEKNFVNITNYRLDITCLFLLLLSSFVFFL